MNKKFTSALLLLGALIMSVSAQAAYVQLSPTPQANDGTIDLPPAGFTATYSTSAPISSIWFNGSVSPQNPTAVSNSITSQFGGTLTLVDQDDSFSSGSISTSGAFDVLAIHLGGQGGGNELLFFFDSPITSFDVTTFSAGGGNNLSNFRAYSTGAVVPVPAAVWLFASGLIGLFGVSRRK